jgi:hypothetical protein
MLTQQEWVEGCYAYYAENGYEPGNPEDGEWEDAHYPVPKCEGGEVTIKLLKQHHAVQGVLQSEEYQRPCIYGWEANCLEGEMLALCKKWQAEKARQMMATLTPEVLSERIRKGRARMAPELRQALARRAGSTMTTEQRSAAARLGQARMTPERRRAIALKAAATQRRNREAAMLRNVTTP